MWNDFHLKKFKYFFNFEIFSVVGLERPASRDILPPATLPKVPASACRQGQGPAGAAVAGAAPPAQLTRGRPGAGSGAPHLASHLA